MLKRMIAGLENYLWTKVFQRMMHRVSAIEGREMTTDEIIDIEPLVAESLPGPTAEPTTTKRTRVTKSK